MTTTRYPEIEVQLTGTDGNAFSIIGKVTREMNRFGIAPESVDEFTHEAMSGDYDHLLRTVMSWVEVS